MPSHQIQGTITKLLKQWHGGDQDAFNQLLTLIYDTLCQLARKELAKERHRDFKGLDTGDVVHKAYLSLAQKNMVNYKDRVHFFFLAARSIRRVLIQNARSRVTEKRGMGYFQFTLDEDIEGFKSMSREDILLLDDLLDKLSVKDELASRIVELRFFGGFSVVEIAEILEVSTPTVKRKWRFSRTWLFKKLTGKSLDGDV